MNLSHLNDKQIEACKFDEGVLLILAGAGSGKTGVLTNRIAYLIETKRAYPSEILAITFTNKAAREMKSRVKSFIGDKADSCWISTFHAFCSRVLRRYKENIGYSNSFTIYDTSDKISLIKECMNELAISKDYFKPSTIGSYISDAKDQMITPKKYEEKYLGEYRMEKIASLYSLYQEKLKKNNAMDFDDLIFNTLILFKEDEEALSYYQNKFKYIMVDEYQDTNYTQYMLIKLLSKKNKNLVVVGDDDQSIYAWRGADIRNILEFEKDFSDVKIIKLEQNYRSTSNIINCANSVIQNNAGRKDKRLWTNHQKGEKVTVYRAMDENDEANFIVKNILKLKEKGYKNTDFAVLYRINALSRKFEEKLVQNHLKYKVFGGFKFFDRAEIKDILAYLRLIDNPFDEVSFKRVINRPKRGIGNKTVEKIEKEAYQNDKSMLEIINDAKNYGFTGATLKKVTRFAELIEVLRSLAKIMNVKDLLDEILKSTSYIKYLQEENTLESRSKIENINELFSVVEEFEKANEDKSLSNLLQQASLSTDMDEEENGEYISLMTIHSAKGLEFPVVFLAGAEESIFPSTRSLETEDGLEEERRLAYVAITRAKNKLFITHAARRMLYGKTEGHVRSRFLDELDDEFIDDKESSSYSSSGSSASGSIYQKYVEKYRIHNQNKIKTPPKELSVGTKVRHKIFGEGMIVSKNGNQYAVAFDGKGIKRIDTTVVKLDVI